MSDTNSTTLGGRWDRSGTLKTRLDHIFKKNIAKVGKEKTKKHEAVLKASRCIDSGIEKETVSTVGQQSHTSFQLFNRLPIEIRLKIWHLAILQPRLVQIRAGKKLMLFSEDIADRCIDLRNTVESKSWTPPQICKESRHEISRLGSKLCFEARIKTPVFFDGSKDTLIMSPDVLKWFLKVEDPKLRTSQFRDDSVKFLAIYPYDQRDHSYNEGSFYPGQGIEANAWKTIFDSMRAFGDLEEIYFVIENKDGFPIEYVHDKWRIFVERKFDKEKKIWDTIRDMTGRECRRYAVPKMMFLTLEELKAHRNISSW